MKKIQERNMSSMAERDERYEKEVWKRNGRYWRDERKIYKRKRNERDRERYIRK